MKSVHYCPATMKTMERTYTDLTSLDAYPSTAVYPTQVWTSQLSSSVADSHARLFGSRPRFSMTMFGKVAEGKSILYLKKNYSVLVFLLRSLWGHFYFLDSDVIGTKLSIIHRQCRRA